jgi:hypothetical protein
MMHLKDKLKVVFIVIGITIVTLGTYYKPRSVKAQELPASSLYTIEVGQVPVKASPGEIVGFSCASGPADAHVRCFVLVRE